MTGVIVTGAEVFAAFIVALLVIYFENRKRERERDEKKPPKG